MVIKTLKKRFGCALSCRVFLANAMFCSVVVTKREAVRLYFDKEMYLNDLLYRIGIMKRENNNENWV